MQENMAIPYVGLPVRYAAGFFFIFTGSIWFRDSTAVVALDRRTSCNNTERANVARRIQQNIVITAGPVLRKYLLCKYIHPECRVQLHSD